MYRYRDPNPSGIYQLKCNTCNNAYVGQSGRPITIRHKEHIRYIHNNNPTSAYVTHILDNRHEFGPAEESLKLLKPCTKGTKNELLGNLLYASTSQTAHIDSRTTSH